MTTKIEESRGKWSPRRVHEDENGRGMKKTVTIKHYKTAKKEYPQHKILDKCFSQSCFHLSIWGNRFPVIPFLPSSIAYQDALYPIFKKIFS
ncbi:hypothetical protein [Cytobacillus sp. AMY 15.2]|uniref:hypothetical protein n=1 Tax=Cytobacillus sp. AMY 15.2 TaxID=2939563 RepID=UPI0020407DE0|nr:hypothetical protein [Cytobacillus sp. AMY 15.2]